MDSVCFEDECKSICDLVDLLALIRDDLSDFKLATPPAHTIEELRVFFDIIQTSKSLVLTDEAGNLITGTVTSSTPVVGFGLRVKVGNTETTVSHRLIYAEGDTVLPVSRLLDPNQQLADAYITQFVEAICKLLAFYQLQLKLCPRLVDICNKCPDKKEHYQYA